MDTAGELFERHRPALSVAAVRILGNRVDADDVLQEAWLRWRRVDHQSVADPGAYLFRLVTRQAIDEVRRVRARRETHAGDGRLEELVAETPAGPRPIDGGTGHDGRPGDPEPAGARGVPAARRFGFTHAEIATVVGRTERAVQQMAYRARQRVRARRPRFQPTRGEHRSATERFLAAADLGADLVGYGQACAAEAGPRQGAGVPDSGLDDAEGHEGPAGIARNVP